MMLRRMVAVAFCLFVLFAVLIAGGHGDSLAADENKNSLLQDVLPTAKALVHKGSCGENLVWEYDTVEQTLVIRGNGPMYPYEEIVEIPWYYYRARINSLVIEEGVTSVCAFAFKYFSSLSSVTLPTTLHKIGVFAFDESLYYKTKSNWKDGMLLIDRHLIEVDFDQLPQHFELPSDLLTIGENAFCNCVQLKQITIPTTVQYIGDYAFAYCENLEKIEIPSKITSLNFNVFAYCSSLSEITFAPGTDIEIIYEEAFKNCFSLKEINIPASTREIRREAFSGCTSLQSVFIPQNLSYIGENAFGFCALLAAFEVDEMNSVYCSVDGVLYSKDLTRLLYYPAARPGDAYEVPDTVTKIDAYTFFNCICLTHITISDAVTEIAPFAFYSCSALQSITLSRGIEIINSYTFYECSALQSVVIPESVHKICDYAFAGCDSLSEITLPDSLTYISATAVEDTACYKNPENRKDGVFYIGNHLIAADASVLAGTYTVAEGTRTIAPFAFAHSKLLSAVLIPDTVTHIGEQAFYACTALENITLSRKLQRIGFAAFEETAFFEKDENWTNGILCLGNCLLKADAEQCSGVVDIDMNVRCIAEQAFSACEKVTQIDLPYGIQTVPAAAFYACTALRSVYFPHTVSTVGESAFYDCTALEEVSLQENVKRIGLAAFRNCTALRSVLIPQGVQLIDSLAFDGCTALEKVYHNGTEEDGAALIVKDGNAPLLLAENIYNVPYAAAMKGDIDCNRTVDSSDARLALRLAVDLEKLDPYQIAAADIDGDGTVSSTDARYILRRSVGLYDPVWDKETQA